MSGVMAVMDDRICHPTEALILPKPRRHFRVGLRCEHWQLRSQIGVSSSRYVYYVTGTTNTQVHKLDIQTHQSEVVKILTFAPRCLVAKNGWVSCGGEHGECVAFEVDESPETSDTTESATAERTLGAIHDYIARSSDVLDNIRDDLNDVRERIQQSEAAEFDAMYADMPDLVDEDGIPIPSTAPTANAPPGINSDKNIVARSKCFGKERINCITLWFPPTSTVRKYSGAYSQSVAVLANNDKHVTVVGLDSQEAMDEVSYPDYVNRALMSPDGQLLVAICDDPYLYVHERVPKQGTAGLGPFIQKDLADFEWKLCAKIHLKSQRKEDRSDQRGSFAACFSNTGRYLAVGTQYGVISVFETAGFREPGFDPLITTFTSSRPKEDVGAVRDMAFCPGPYDLLAWTEHRGRVGVADIRNNYVSRQILDINKYDDYEQIMVTEQGSIDPRLLRRNDEGVLAYSPVAEPTNAAAARRMARRPTTERATVETTTITTTSSARDYHPPLGADETMVLEALSAHRRRRDQANAETTGRNSPAAGTRLLERLSNRGARGGAFYRGLEDVTRDRDRGVSELDRARAQTERLRETAERVRARRLLESARLLNSNATNTAEAVTDAVNLTQTATTTAERAASVAAALRTLRQGIEPPGGRVWNTADVDTLYQNFDLLGGGGTEREGDGGAGPMRDRDYLASVWSTILRNREELAETAATTGMPAPRTNRRLAERMAMNMNRMDHEHDDTAGLAWSEDGRVLIIGAEDGLYEFHVDLFSRKLYPSITMR